MARIELSAEVRAIETLIDAGEHTAASTRLHAAHQHLGRRPEYRYLVCLYDSTFRVRSDRDLLTEMIELVGEQPDLLEAAALLAQLYTRLGDTSRADLFAHLALESTNPSARSRAEEVLQAIAGGENPASSRVQQVDRLPEPVEPIPPSTRPSSAPPPSARASSAPPSQSPSSSTRPSSAPAWSSDATPTASLPVALGVPPSSTRQSSARFPSAPPPSELPNHPALPPTALDAWFDRVRRDMVHRRSPTYGVRTGPSVAETLLDWGKTVAEGRTFVTHETLPLTRDGLAAVDDAILALRRQPGQRSASRSDTSRAMAAGGFFLAVVVHELDATVLEIAPDDGGCKVLLPSGAGVRPLLVAAAFADGTGPSLVQTFDRLAAARELASSGTASEAPYRRASLQVSLTPVSSPAVSTPRVELALTRPEVEATPLRLLARATEPGDPPPLDLARIAADLADSPLSQDIASRSGTVLTPSPASLEALDSFCLATRGESGTAPDRATWQPPDEDEDLILTWGALLGETLIASYGGIWECDPNAPSDPRLFRVICEERVAAWPITQVYLRLKNGSRASLVEYLAAVGRLLE